MKYFGTDGIRGIVNEDLTVEFLQQLGKTLKVLNINKIYIGYDSRISNYLVLTSLVSGLLSVGIDVNNIGMVSTPLIQYISKKYKIVTLMITASHNPYFYNGIKIFRNGEKLSDNEEELIEESIGKEQMLKTGKYEISTELTNDYIEYLKSFKKDNKYKILIDLANGATINIAKNIFDNDENIKLINDTPSGININDNCGSLFIEKQDIKDYDYLFSFDGDGDRMLFKDKNRLYDGDLIVFILAKYYKMKKVVLTNNANPGLLKAFKKEKIKVYFSPVGDKNVYDLMIKEEAKLGGENSGHIINQKYMNSGDGLLNALIMIQILNKINIEKYIENIEYYPQVKFNVPTSYSFEKLKEIQNKYKRKARINIRKSGTENVIRIDISSKNEKVIKNIEKEIKENE